MHRIRRQWCRLQHQQWTVRSSGKLIKIISSVEKRYVPTLLSVFSFVIDPYYQGRSKPDCTEEASYDDGRIRPKTGYFYDTSEPESTYASDGSEGMSSVKDALLAGAKNAMMAIPMAIGGGLAALRAGSGNTVTQ